MSLERAYLDGKVTLPTAANGETVKFTLFAPELFVDGSATIDVPVGYPATFCSLDLASLEMTSIPVSEMDLLWIPGDEYAQKKTLGQPCPVVANADHAYAHIDYRVQGNDPVRKWYRLTNESIDKTLTSAIAPANILVWQDAIIADTKLIR